MAISNKKKAGGVALLTVGSLALVGVGAGAAFTDTVKGDYSFKAGTANLEVTGVPGSNTSGAILSGDGQSLTLPVQIRGSAASAGSEWGGQEVKHFYVKNAGDVDLKPTVTVEAEGPLAEKVTTLNPAWNFGDAAKAGVLKAGETATLSIYYKVAELENADMGSHATIKFRVDGTDQITPAP